MSDPLPTIDALLRHDDFVRALAANLLRGADAPAAADLAQDTLAAAIERPPPRDWSLQARPDQVPGASEPPASTVRLQRNR